jgi:hypothetical protein
MLSAVVRWSRYTRRSVVTDRSESEADLVVLAAANVEL